MDQLRAGLSSVTVYSPPSSPGPSDDSDTFTHELRGIIPRSFEYIFSLINRERQKVRLGEWLRQIMSWNCLPPPSFVLRLFLAYEPGHEAILLPTAYEIWFALCIHTHTPSLSHTHTHSLVILWSFSVSVLFWRSIMNRCMIFWTPPLPDSISNLTPHAHTI